MVVPHSRPDRRHLRRLFLGGGAVLFALGMLVALFGSTSVAARQAMPIDFNVNWTAAQRLVDHRPLYDRHASHTEAVAEIGDEMRVQDDCLFCGFVGPPATALLHATFLPLGHDGAVAWFRVLAVLGMIAAVVVTARVLPSASRLPATLLGLGALLVSFPLANTIDVGQGNEFVMLGIAFGIYGAMRRRWAVCGIGLGVATILKVSPVLLVIYLVARGRRLPALWAAGTVGVLSAVAAVVGRPVELVHWLRHVAPAIGHGSIHVWNQSLVGWLARVTSSGHVDATVQSTLAPIWSLVAYALAAGALFALWARRRRVPLQPLELGAVCLVALLVGPLSWEHYFVWAFVPFVLCFDLDLWIDRSRREVAVLIAALAVGTCLLAVPLQTLWSMTDVVAWRAVITGPATIAALLYLAVAARLLWRPDARARPRVIARDAVHATGGQR